MASTTEILLLYPIFVTLISASPGGFRRDGRGAGWLPD